VGRRCEAGAPGIAGARGGTDLQYNVKASSADAKQPTGNKLDGRVAGGFFDTKAAEWRAEQDRIMRDIERHQAANQNYIEEGIQLLDLARRAADLYEKQDASSRRELLGFILSNSVCADGKLTAEFRQPFNILALATAEVGKESAKEFDKGARFEKWYPLVDVYRTFCLNPTRDGRSVIARIGQVVAMAS